MVRIQFESQGPLLYAHIWSTTGVLGHAQEIQDRIPKGTLVTLPPRLHRLMPWMVKKCKFSKVAEVVQDNQLLVVLVKE